MMPVSMVGRDVERAELNRAWAALAGADPASGRAERPGPRPVVITGDAGVGKSRLVADALDGFAPRPGTVLVGRARVHSPAPYDWLAGVLSDRPVDGLPVPRHALAWLAQQPDVPPERYAPDALLRLAVRTVRALLGSGPAVLVVEDLHALDPASLNLIAELAGTPDLPVLLLVTSRPPEASVSPELVARTLARLSGVPGALRQHLGPLAGDEVAELLRRAYPDRPVEPELAEAVRARTGGNPYWLVELLAVTRGTAPDALVAHPVPEHLRLVAPRSPAGEEPGDPPRSPAGEETGDAPLTAREVEVLACLAEGMSNKQVARQLGISIRTVAVHVSNLLRKTRSASRTEAALWAVRHRLVDATAGTLPSSSR